MNVNASASPRCGTCDVAWSLHTPEMWNQCASAVACPTCLLPQSDHTEEMAANCAVFDLSVSSSGQDSEAETSDARVPQSPPGMPSARASEPLGISTASVLLGWCNDIKRELEEFANDGPVGPMVPYRLEANTRMSDLDALLASLRSLSVALLDLEEDVVRACLKAGV